MAAITILAAVLIPLGGIAEAGAAGAAAGLKLGAGFGELTGEGALPGVGAPVVDVPHLPQNCAVSPNVPPQFLQNLLMAFLRVIERKSQNGWNLHSNWALQLPDHDRESKKQLTKPV